MSRPRAVYLIDFACYKPPENLKLSRQAFMDHIRSIGKFNEASLEFQGKAMERSGMGEETYLPPAVKGRRGKDGDVLRHRRALREDEGEA